MCCRNDLDKQDLARSPRIPLDEHYHSLGAVPNLNGYTACGDPRRQKVVGVCLLKNGTLNTAVIRGHVERQNLFRSAQYTLQSYILGVSNVALVKTLLTFPGRRIEVRALRNVLEPRPSTPLTKTPAWITCSLESFVPHRDAVFYSFGQASKKNVEILSDLMPPSNLHIIFLRSRCPQAIPSILET